MISSEPSNPIIVVIKSPFKPMFVSLNPEITHFSMQDTSVNFSEAPQFSDVSDSFPVSCSPSDNRFLIGNIPFDKGLPFVDKVFHTALANSLIFIKEFPVFDLFSVKP